MKKAISLTLALLFFLTSVACSTGLSLAEDGVLTQSSSGKIAPSISNLNLPADYLFKSQYRPVACTAILIDVSGLFDESPLDGGKVLNGAVENGCWLGMQSNKQFLWMIGYYGDDAVMCIKYSAYGTIEYTIYDVPEALTDSSFNHYAAALLAERDASDSYFVDAKDIVKSLESLGVSISSK